MATILQFERKPENYDKNREVKLLLARAASLLDEMGDKERRVGWLVSECSALLSPTEDFAQVFELPSSKRLS